MKTFTITSESGTHTYSAETQAGALRQHTTARPGESVLGIAGSSEYRAQADALESFAD